MQVAQAACPIPWRWWRQYILSFEKSIPNQSTRNGGDEHNMYTYFIFRRSNGGDEQHFPSKQVSGGFRHGFEVEALAGTMDDQLATV
jgi:hypothetical protein